MDALAQAFFDLAPAALLLRPVYDARGELTDFACDHLNAAAQLLLRQPARPGPAFWPLPAHPAAVGLLAFYREAFLAAADRRCQADYPDHSARYQLSARRVGEQLVVTLAAAPAAPTLPGQLALLSLILGQVPAAIATLSGPEHRFSFANAQYQQLVGQRAELGRTVAETMPEVGEQGFIDLLDQVYASGQPYVGTEITLMLTQPDGAFTQRYFNFVYQPLFSGQGQVEGILVFALEVTEQVRTRRQSDTLQAALLAVAQRQARERLELLHIFEQAPVAIALLREPEHRLDYVNALFSHFLPAAQPGLTIAEAFPAIKTRVLARLDHVFNTGETHQEVELRLPGPAAEAPRYVTLTCQAYREQEHIVGVAVLLYDVTDQVRAGRQVLALNAELTASNHQLLRTNAELDSFVYAASHDLKAPIANLEGLLLALRQDLPAGVPAAPRVAHLLGLVDNSIGRFRQTITQLTDVARLSQDADTPTEPVDLAALVESVRQDLAAELTETGAQLTVELAAGPPVRFVPAQLRSVVYNLLSNALRYRAPGRVPQIALRTSYAAGRLVLAVQDNGLGLDAEQQGKLFRLFKRLHPHVQGSGVSLYAVKKVVENAGGTIGVQSAVGVGSTFTVTLPLRPGGTPGR
ncbi:MAG TPA: ATP-binding protein [Hymenobacter sp.]|uniref:sensor histidine kinase n=1 Tax=Hymenobacter sp. TaxID=1898978 RepID=UPI002D7F8E6B|nr:ATP-binding protein [Hymenobacter sp.]HET9506094.1 ATP-binding protein [Hymenobacter sp.]